MWCARSIVMFSIVISMVGGVPHAGANEFVKDDPETLTPTEPTDVADPNSASNDKLIVTYSVAADCRSASIFADLQVTNSDASAESLAVPGAGGTGLAQGKAKQVYRWAGPAGSEPDSTTFDVTFEGDGSVTTNGSCSAPDGRAASGTIKLTTRGWGTGSGLAADDKPTSELGEVGGQAEKIVDPNDPLINLKVTYSGDRVPAPGDTDKFGIEFNLPLPSPLVQKTQGTTWALTADWAIDSAPAVGGSTTSSTFSVTTNAKCLLSAIVSATGKWGADGLATAAGNVTCNMDATVDNIQWTCSQ